MQSIFANVLVMENYRKRGNKLCPCTKTLRQTVGWCITDTLIGKVRLSKQPNEALPQKEKHWLGRGRTQQGKC